ncbi:MAG TPA: acyltransferase [Planctomycetaceae bacterium]|nr:acyltransferase [Planctomycetaceae bacterium]
MAESSPVPTISQPLMAGFYRFLPRFLKKNFHAVAANSEALSTFDTETQRSVVVYANHASWWDPMTAMFLQQAFFSGFRMYAPIDAEALEKYKIFKRMGFYPIRRDSSRGAAEFLKTTRQILATPGASVWMTPEGRFVDPRERDAGFMPGLSHLASRMSTRPGPVPVTFIPVAIEYSFWEESKPELLVWFGHPIETDTEAISSSADKEAWDTLLRLRLREAQNRLSHASIARDSSQFKILLGGKTGSFFIYDWYRKFRGISTDHSDKLST